MTKVFKYFQEVSNINLEFMFNSMCSILYSINIILFTLPQKGGTYSYLRFTCMSISENNTKPLQRKRVSSQTDPPTFSKITGDKILFLISG